MAALHHVYHAIQLAEDNCRAFDPELQEELRTVKGLLRVAKVEMGAGRLGHPSALAQTSAPPVVLSCTTFDRDFVRHGLSQRALAICACPG